MCIRDRPSLEPSSASVSETQVPKPQEQKQVEPATKTNTPVTDTPNTKPVVKYKSPSKKRESSYSVSKPSVKKVAKKTPAKKAPTKKKSVNKVDKPKPKTQKNKIEQSANTTKSIESKAGKPQASGSDKVVAYEVDLAKLPLSIGENWTLSRDGNTDEQCALSYRKITMADGQGETPVFVIITQDEVLFKTKSNIDVTYKQTGLTIDDKPQLPIEKLHNDFSVSYKEQYQLVINQMKTGNQAILTLGFWPSWPVTHTYSKSLALGEFSAAQQALMNCLTLEKELK